MSTRAPGHTTKASRRIAARRAFTLLEAMIAMGIFFIAVFAILDLVSTSLRNARRLQQARVDCGLAIADLYQATQFEESTTNGDFGILYPGYEWEQTIESAGTNGLFHVEYILIHPDRTRETNLDAFMWKPESKLVTPKS